MAAHIEFKNPFKWTPGTIENAKYNTMPLITNENNPRVKNVIGNEIAPERVLMTKHGLIINDVFDANDRIKQFTNTLLAM